MRKGNKRIVCGLGVLHLAAREQPETSLMINNALASRTIINMPLFVP